jgi:uncharacterized membrane protein
MHKIFLRYMRESLCVIDSFFFLVNPVAMSLAMYLLILLNKFILILKIHLHPMALVLIGNSTRSHTLVLFIEFISFFLKLYQNSDSLQLIAYENDLGSFLAPML